MDIRNQRERKIRCVANCKSVFGGGGENSHLLIVGELYTLVDIEVHSWHTLVWLKEFPGKEFNSVLFEELEEAND